MALSSEVLDLAAKLIEMNGLCKRVYTQSFKAVTPGVGTTTTIKQHCTIGAVIDILNGLDDPSNIRPDNRHTWVNSGDYAVLAIDTMNGYMLKAIIPVTSNFPSDEAREYEDSSFLGTIEQYRIHRAIADWNDVEERTMAEVVAALRIAAQLAREDGN